MNIYHMKNILIKFNISYYTYLFLIICFFCGFIKNILILFMIIIIHELGHILIIKILKYKIDRICGSQEDTTLHIIFWGYKHDPGDILLKSNNSDFRLGTYECDWQYLGEGWYIRRAGWNDRNGLPHHFAQEKP